MNTKILKTAVTLFFGFTGCKPASNFNGALEPLPGVPPRTPFVGAAPAAPATGIPTIAATAVPSNALQDKREIFSISTIQTEIDIVWVIDNSGSMAQEAQNVRQNFRRFIDSISSRANLRLALISLSGDTGTAVSIPISGPNYLHLNKQVGSTNPLAIAASATCSRQQTSEFSSNWGSFGWTGNEIICNQRLARSYLGNTPIEDGAVVGTIRGELEGFLRPTAKRIYVFVTDDDSIGIDASNFLAGVAQGATRPPRVYAFAGINENTSPLGGIFGGVLSSGCHISRRGKAYLELAQQTQGEVFDICAQDWTQHFSKLTESILKVSTDQFKLKTKPAKIHSVSVDGVIVSTSNYSVDGDTVRLTTDDLLKPENKLVEIQYSTAEN